jgi:hypothetical protein
VWGRAIPGSKAESTAGSRGLSTAFEGFIDCLKRHGCDPTKNGTTWKARCPAHADSTPSLSIGEGDDGRVLINCHAHCKTGAVLKELGLTMADLFSLDPMREPAASNSKAKGKRDAVFATRDAAVKWMAGKLKATVNGEWKYNEAFYVVRFDYKTEKGKAAKKCPPFRHDPDGWRIKDPVGKLPLYRLEEIAAALVVDIHEGEKCVDLARGLGLVATTSSHGCGSADKTDWTPLAGKTVRIFPDNDQAGDEYAEDVAQILSKLDHKPMVKIVKLPLVNHGDDIAEWLEGVVPDTWGDAECRAELERLAAAASEWMPKPSQTASSSDRPIIAITTEEHKVNGKVLAALRRDPDLFRFGYMLATVITDPDPPRGVEYPDGPSPQINQLAPAILREHMTKAVRFLKLKVKGESAIWVPAHPPDFAISALHERKVYPGIRPIEGVIEAPTLRPDGSILSAPGYDPPTRLYLQPNVQIDPIPDQPGRHDAEQSLELIYDLVTDFPFKSETHKTVWLTGLFTVLGRASFMGPAPLIAFDGNAPGSGKTKLADLIAIIASGRRMPRSAWPGGDNADEEVRKRITSLAVQGERFVLLDNVDCELGGGPLDAAMTGDTWKDRLLGTNTVAEIPMKMVWFATGNNLGFRGDFVRRALAARLETPLERPEERKGFKYPDLLEHAQKNRAQILRAALLILRAYRAEGSPKEVDPLGSFEKWTHAIVDPVYWITGLNPFDVRADVRVADKGTQTRAALVEGWAELNGGTITGVTVADALRQLKEDDEDAKRDKRPARFQVLRNALADLTDRGDLPSARSIGRYLSGMRGRVVGGKTLTGFELRSGVYAWKVIDASTV